MANAIRYLRHTGVMKVAMLLLVACAVAYEPLPGAAPPRYEVASIKPSNDNDPRYSFDIEPGGSLSAAGITIKRLLMTAYNVQGFRIVGGPAWVGSRRWQVQAKPDRAASPQQIRPMLRALLQERFQLRAHSETRKLPVYELVNDRGGAKIPAAKDTGSKPTVRVAPGAIELTNATSATLAGQLSYAVARPVIDQTNLAGRFDFALTWTPEPGEDGGPATSGLPPGSNQQTPSIGDAPSIFTAIREQLGLRLKSGRAPIEVIVIDDVRLPSRN